MLMSAGRALGQPQPQALQRRGPRPARRRGGGGLRAARQAAGCPLSRTRGSVVLHGPEKRSPHGSAASPARGWFEGSRHCARHIRIGNGQFTGTAPAARTPVGNWLPHPRPPRGCLPHSSRHAAIWASVSLQKKRSSPTSRSPA